MVFDEIKGFQGYLLMIRAMDDHETAHALAKSFDLGLGLKEEDESVCVCFWCGHRSALGVCIDSHQMHNIPLSFKFSTLPSSAPLLFSASYLLIRLTVLDLRLIFIAFH